MKIGLRALHCLISPETIRPVEEVRRRFASAHAEVIDFDNEDRRNAENIRTVPTFVLNGKVLYWGNPRDNDLFHSLAEALVASEGK